MTNINIDTEAIQAIAQKAILEGLGQDQRDLIMQQAIESLLRRPEPQRFGGEPGPSPLQEAFTRAVVVVANDVAREVVAGSEEIRERIREMMGEVIAEMLGGEGYSEASEMFASALTAAIRERLRQHMGGR